MLTVVFTGHVSGCQREMLSRINCYRGKIRFLLHFLLHRPLAATLQLISIDLPLFNHPSNHHRRKYTTLQTFTAFTEHEYVNIQIYLRFLRFSILISETFRVSREVYQLSTSQGFMRSTFVSIVINQRVVGVVTRMSVPTT